MTTSSNRPIIPTLFDECPSLLLQDTSSVASTKSTWKSSVIIDSNRYHDLARSTNSITESIPSEISPEGRARAPLQVLAAFMALSLSIFLVALDSVLVPTALPIISQSFYIPDSLYAWIGSAYLLANAASVPFWGRLSDVFGRKPVVVIANMIFLFGGIICAISINGTMLVAGRAVQGLGGGGVIVLVHICVSDLFSIRDRSFYMGSIGAVWALASALGPVFGGIFSEKLNWRWCFYFNLPIVSLAIIVLHFTLDVHIQRTSLLSGLASMDWIGTFTIITATILLLVGLQVGSTSSYKTPPVITCLVLGSVAYTAFPFSQWWEHKRGGSPMMPLRIFKDVSNLSALGVCACDALVFNSVAYFLPLYFQIVLHCSPTVTGVYMLAIAVPLATISFASGHVIEKTGRFLEVLQAGLFIMTLGIGLLILLDASLKLEKAIGILVVLGLGFGPNFAAPLIALQTRIQESDIATGTATFSFVRMLSGAIGIVFGQLIFQLLMAPHLESFVDSGISGQLANTLTSGKAISQAMAVNQLPKAQQIVVQNSFIRAFRGTWVLYTVIGALGLLVSFGIKRTKLHREVQSTELETLEGPATGGGSGVVLRQD